MGIPSSRRLARLSAGLLLAFLLSACGGPLPYDKLRTIKPDEKPCGCEEVTCPSGAACTCYSGRPVCLK